jgi:hypothetical protein
MDNYPNRGWRSCWIVSLEDCTATHCDGWVFQFARTPGDDDPTALDGRIISPQSPFPMELVASLARIAQEAGEIYMEALNARH